MSRTTRFFLIACAGLALLAAPGLVWSAYRDAMIGPPVVLLYLSGLLLHALGAPGLLVNNGACGWGWCNLTTFGWAFVAVLWLGLIYGLCALIARATRR